MKRWARNWRIWVLVGIVLMIAALVPVFARFGDTDLTATSYADVIRFEAGGAVASLQIRIFDLSGRELWDSGEVPGRIVDWARLNEWGERLAYGNYLYRAVGRNSNGAVVLERNGKLTLLPGDKVQLQAAPGLISKDQAPLPSEGSGNQVKPLAYDYSGNLTVSGKLGVGTDNPTNPLHVLSVVNYGIRLAFSGTSIGRFQIAHPANTGFQLVKLAGANPQQAFSFAVFESGANNLFTIWDDTAHKARMVIEGGTGNVGIGTTSPGAALEVHGTADDLLALYDSTLPGDAKFRIEKDGDVYADGTYYCSDGAVYVGSADVAERINVSEWVEASNVVEVDPEHPGFFRKTRSPYSNKVAGVISTSPGVVLGNSFDAAEDKWEDNRLTLAIAGRVPVKASAENGPIEVGDLLVSSSIPGIAMKATDKTAGIGSVIGKAMEELKEENGIIMMQVMLQ